MELTGIEQLQLTIQKLVDRIEEQDKEIFQLREEVLSLKEQLEDKPTITNTLASNSIGVLGGEA